jgi:hypothetical protein
MRVGGKDGLAVTRRQFQQGGPQLERRLDHPGDKLPLSHPVHRHVDVVPAPRRVQTARHLFAARLHEQPFHEEEEVFTRAVVRRLPDVAHRNGVQRLAQHPGIGCRHDAAVGEHDEMGVMDRHQRGEEQRLGVFEVLVEDLSDVLGVEPHLAPV